MFSITPSLTQNDLLRKEKLDCLLNYQQYYITTPCSIKLIQFVYQEMSRWYQNSAEDATERAQNSEKSK